MAAGQTCIQYGELLISNCQTLVFDQEMVREESDTDQLYFKFRVRVVGFLHGRTANLSSAPPSYWNPSTAIYPTPGDGSAGHHHYSIRHLLRDRQYFEMRTGASFNSSSGQISGGMILLKAGPFQSDSDFRDATAKDVNNGPKCRVMNITEISGDTAIRVELEFEICKVECDSLGNCANTSGVLSNRWSCIDEIDQNFYTTRTFRGRLRTVSSKINANSFRNFVVPPVQPGMRREAMEFAVSTDGLYLEYGIIDREVAFAPPAPATTWRMTHTESVQREGELGFYSEVNVTLGGDRLCDPKKLISIAVAIAEAKILQELNKTACYLQSVSITHETGDNANLVHLHARGRRVEKVAAVLGVAAGRMGKPIEAKDLAKQVQDYDRNLSRGARKGDKLEVAGPISMVGAWAAYLQQPCSIQHKIYESQDGREAPVPESKSSASLAATVISEIPSDNSLDSYSTATTEAMYTFYKMQSTYESMGIRAHLPIARQFSLGGAPLDGPTSVVASLGPSLTKRVIRVTASRIGKEPSVANPAETFEDGGINYTLISKKILAGVPERTADDKRVYSCTAELVYALDRNPDEGVSLRFGSNPWEEKTSGDGIYRKVLKQVDEGVAA